MIDGVIRNGTRDTPVAARMPKWKRIKVLGIGSVMTQSLIRAAKYLFSQTKYEVRRRLPTITLEPLDLILALYEAHRLPMAIMQVGACDGVTGDPIREHALRGAAQCILIEPNPFAFERLQKAYDGIPNITLLQTAIGLTDGEIPLYRIKKTPKSQTEEDFTLQIASFYKEHLLKHGVAAEDIEQITVPSRSLASLIRDLTLNKIDVLQIDAEGFDAAIVRMALNLSTPPDVINFEHIHLRNADRQPLFDQLATGGYLLGYDHMNCIAVQRSFMDGIRTRNSISTQ